MFICNTTVNINPEIEKKWVEWVKKEYFPLYAQIDIVEDIRLFRILTGEEYGGLTYAIQIYFKDKDSYQKFESDYMFRLDNIHIAKFANAFVSFRSLISEI